MSVRAGGGVSYRKKAGFSLLSLVGIVYLGSTVEEIA